MRCDDEIEMRCCGVVDVVIGYDDKNMKGWRNAVR